MSKFYGIRPAPATRQAVEEFENDALIRHNNQLLVGSVYVDMQDAAWAVAFAYNISRTPGIRGHENVLEIRYLTYPQEKGVVRIIRVDEMIESVMDHNPFPDRDDFIRFVLAEEHSRTGRAA